MMLEEKKRKSFAFSFLSKGVCVWDAKIWPNQDRGVAEMGKKLGTTKKNAVFCDLVKIQNGINGDNDIIIFLEYERHGWFAFSTGGCSLGTVRWPHASVPPIWPLVIKTWSLHVCVRSNGVDGWPTAFFSPTVSMCICFWFCYVVLIKNSV